ncbi:MAG TPA: SGNH/GDSL hydrolase family protein [Candidatus Melainabacteria bacterium]|jgi:hypothetical protein|nr:SGNH/GDSL hydrolase family protein [Candidatus Melainabacteria bacterium]HIN64989.1 SGNH/GDSL hydrolase family protein [Candidatus Obscuribacterales bacterium]
MTTAAPQKIENKPSAVEKAPKSSGDWKSKLSKWTKLALTVIAWQIVAILLVEFTLSLAGLGEEEIYKLDKTFGFVHMNNKRVTWRSEGFARSYFGPDGMREPGLTIQKPPGVFRIALLGDSMVESLQVPLEQTFGQLLEKELKKSSSGKEIQILNFGNSGYSTAQEDLQLKNKALKYSPDAVVVFYSHRDLFENWSPPDQTITNVRPYALHLPNQPLSIDTSSVTAWMKSPRGKFLTSIGWVRQHSRIWGLISAWETQASFNDPVYRAVVGFLTNPVKTLSTTAASLSQITPKVVWDETLKGLKINSKSSFKIQTFEDGKKTASSKSAAAAEKEKAEADAPTVSEAERINPSVNSSIINVPSMNEFPAAKLRTEEEIRAAEAKEVENKQKAVFFNLMYKTVNSLFADMKKQCEEHGAKFAIVIAPSNLALTETSTTIGPMDLLYHNEIEAIKPLVKENGIPFLDLQEYVEKMPKSEAQKIFYCMHLNPNGHKFVAEKALNLFKSLCDDKEPEKN